MKTNSLVRILLGSALALSMAAPSGLAFAKGSERGDEDNASREAQKENSEGCLKAFGHLIAPGWIKANGSLGISEHCILPFGIEKKFKKEPPAPAPDTTAPIIQFVLAAPHERSATIRWMTSERSDSALFYATSSPVSRSGEPFVSRAARTRFHELEVKNLLPGTKYYAVARSRDAAGNAGFSSEFTFTTEAASSDTRAPVISSVVAVIGTSTARIGWRTNEPATSAVYYSAGTPVDVGASSTFSVKDATLVTNHLLTISNLSAGSTYHAVVESKDSAGNVNASSEFSFTTASP